MSLINTSLAITDPVSVTEVQEHGRISGEDSYITGLIAAARAMAEHETGRVIPEQTFTWVTNDLCDGMELPVYPVSAINSFSYVDVDGATQTIASNQYQIVDKGFRQRLYSLDTWPALQTSTHNRVTITLTAGVTAFSSDIKQAIMMIALGLYENREDEVVGTTVSQISMGSKMILSKYKRFSI